MSEAENVTALRQAVELLGSESAVAAAIGKAQQTVNEVLRAGRPAPATWCIPLERATGGQVTRHQLRPDLYPEHSEAAE